MKTFKILSVLFVLFALIISPIKVQAQDTTTYSIADIKVDGTSILDIDTDITSIEVQRGESMVVEVWIEGDPSADPNNPDEAAEVRVRAELDSNYEDDIEAKTQLVSVFPGTTKKVTLRLNVPQDVDADFFDLLVTVSGGDQEAVSQSVPVKVSGARHYLNIIDVIYNPTTVEAGKNVFAKVRVENLGQLKEEDIKVEMSIPELGLSTRTYIDELVTTEEEKDDNDEETSMTSPEMFLKVPEDADGKYTLRFSVTYNRGRTTEEQSFDLLVRGAPRPTLPTATVGIDTTSQTIEAGKGAVYKLMFSNLGDAPVTYSVDVSGVSAWGSSRVDPDTVTVLPDSTADMFVFVAAQETAQTASQAFNVNVLQNGQLVKQIGLRADVVGKTQVAPQDSYRNIRQGLEVGFIVLLIILVILGLILAARRLGGPKEAAEEPSSKTYY